MRINVASSTIPARSMIVRINVVQGMPSISVTSDFGSHDVRCDVTSGRSTAAWWWQAMSARAARRYTPRRIRMTEPSRWSRTKSFLDTALQAAWLDVNVPW